VQTVILEVSPEAAAELYDAARDIATAQSRKAWLEDIVSAFDENDFQAAKQRRQAGTSPLDYYIRSASANRGMNDPAIAAALLDASRSSSSYTEFKSTVAQMIAEEEAKRSMLSQATLNKSIKTFSGDEKVVPRYIKTFLGRLSRIKVLHFEERRKPIGAEEAQ